MRSNILFLQAANNIHNNERERDRERDRDRETGEYGKARKRRNMERASYLRRLGLIQKLLLVYWV